jgi:sugar O-acyltransferase (sialic acid O-acetyltransferase NeuD family)
MGRAETIFIFGASGHAKVVIDIIEREGAFDVAFLVDDDPALKGQEVYGYRVLGGRPELSESGIRKGIVAIGSNGARLQVARWLTQRGFEMVSAIHPSAQVARGVRIGSGTVIVAGAVLNSDAEIGSNCIVNSRASIDHDCRVADGVHIAPGTTLCGAVSVGPGSFVCAGSVVAPLVRIGSNTVVGAGSTVLRDVPDHTVVVGSPARVLKQPGSTVKSAPKDGNRNDQ